MLDIIAVHRKDRPDRLPLPNGWKIWEVKTEIGQTYVDLADHAIETGWGHEIVIVQDDVRFTTDPNEIEDVELSSVSIIAYGQTKRKYHVCPRAFSADRQGWERLRGLWSPAVNTLCPGFTRALSRDGVVLDVTTVNHG